jgi:hypothetical protein
MPNRPRGRPRGTQTRLLHEHAGHLGRHHFAFLRALLDGVELEQAWTRYLAFSGGPRAESSLKCNGFGRECLALGEFGLDDFGIDLAGGPTQLRSDLPLAQLLRDQQPKLCALFHAQA